MKNHPQKHHYPYGETVATSGAAGFGDPRPVPLSLPSGAKTALKSRGAARWRGWTFLIPSVALHVLFVVYGPSVSAKQSVARENKEKVLVTFGVVSGAMTQEAVEENPKKVESPVAEEKPSSSRRVGRSVAPAAVAEKQSDAVDASKGVPTSVASHTSESGSTEVGPAAVGSSVSGSAQPSSKQPSSKRPSKVASSKTLGSALGPWAKRIGAILLQRARRAYPFAARKNRLEGIVHIAFKIDSRGGLQTVRIKKSSGSPLLDQAALASVRQIDHVPAPPGVPGSFKKSFVLPVSYRLGN